MKDEFIVQCLNIHYGIEVTTLTFLPLGADPNASVYKAQTRDKMSYFVKLKRGYKHDVIVELLQNARIREIIAPIKTNQRQLELHVSEHTFIVYPFVEGQNGFSRHLTNEQWIALGKIVRQVHEIDVPASIQSQMRREVYSPKWREAVRAVYAKIEDAVTCDDASLQLLKFMKENSLTIYKLVDSAEHLAEKLQNQPLKFVFCHSDIHGGNVLMGENETLYIVDWDDPIMAPKERDLMFIGGGVANVWNKPYEEKLFYEGYGKTEVNSTALAYYRYERIVEDIAIYAQELLFTNPKGENRQEMYQQFIDMFAPQGVVKISFRARQ